MLQIFFYTIFSGFTTLLQQLVTGTFIIEKQPPQVKQFYIKLVG